jgi:hypothetical protein
MPKKKGKSVSFDAMVKFFMHTYDIPTKREIVGLVQRLDRIERLLAAAIASSPRARENPRSEAKSGALSASDHVLEIIRRYPEGVGLAQIQLESGFAEKKLRNILFRLYKMGKIARKSRGIYVGR